MHGSPMRTIFTHWSPVQELPGFRHGGFASRSGFVSALDKARRQAVSALRSRTTLHTDQAGLRYLSDASPAFDTTTPTLDALDGEDARLFARGKFAALAGHDEGVWHVDADLFFETAPPVEVWEADAVAAYLEIAGDYDQTYKTLLRKMQSMSIETPIEWKPAIAEGRAFNCGVLGFNNPEAKSLYLQMVNRVIQRVLGNAAFTLLLENDPIRVMCGVEQLTLGSLPEHGFDVYCLNPPSTPCPTPRMIARRQACVQHWLGRPKRCEMSP
ncbi:MAG: DUF6734 family protein [Planctomycetota bacterium]